MHFSILSDEQPSITNRFNTGSNGCQVFTFIVRRRGIVFVGLVKALKRFNVDLKRNTQKIYPPGVCKIKKVWGVFLRYLMPIHYIYASRGRGVKEIMFDAGG